MRIQHNIMAMSAYRNYSNNTSAVAKNLERLSSGYKINRAGDDAAGLAISEKMRAQITGLNAAQKNVKDGISLVKTAEGAMQEIQDMLNRMDYLATQSANGTYDNDVDRAALQKEVEQLKSEINRIADSANFNGIKLLDGSLDGSAVAASTSTAAGKLPAVGEILGKDTVLHKDSAGAAVANEFSVDLHNLTVSGKLNREFSISLGDTKLTATLKADAEGGTALTAEDVANALAGADDTKIALTYEDGTAYDATKVMLGDAEFSTAVNGTRVTFTQTNDEVFDPELKISITAGDETSTRVAKVNTTAGADAVGLTQATYESTTVDAATAVPADFTTAKAGNTYTVTVAGKSYDVTFAAGDDASALLTKWATAFNTANTGFTADVTGDSLVIKTTGTTATEGTFTALGLPAGGTVDNTVDTNTNSTYTITDAVKTAKTDNAGIADKGTNNVYTVTIDGLAQDAKVKLDSDATEIATAWKNAYNADATNKFTAAVKNDKIVLTAKNKGTDAVTGGVAETDTGMTGGNFTAATDQDATAAKTVVDFAGKTGEQVMGGTITIGDKTYEFVLDAAQKQNPNAEAVVITKADTAAQLADKLATAAQAATPTGVDAPVSANGKVTFTTTDTGVNDAADPTVTNASKVAANASKTGADPVIGGDYNVSSTVISKKADAGKDRLASTYFNLTKEMTTDGSVITIGKEKYTFTTDLDNKGVDGMVYVGDLDLSKSADMIEAADRLTKAAELNSTYTVGHDGSRMTFTEVEGQSDFEGKEALTSLENIEKSFGFEIAGKAADDSRSLTLQIGDTSDSFNQMKVSVGDMHTKAMGVADIDISNQEGAATAVQTIKDAINYVSGVRGDLGAIQNRLEHTANNLSVMAENITDAESSIRDTDIAEEMMAYTKNNILVQSAQAMLAQANQVPQGVLQLLG